MSIKWFDQDYRLAVRLRNNVLEFSKEAYEKFGDNQVTVGIDTEKRLIYIKACDKFGYKIIANPAVNRICSTSLAKWLKSNGVEIGKYAAWWDEKNNMLLAKF